MNLIRQKAAPLVIFGGVAALILPFVGVFTKDISVLSFAYALIAAWHLAWWLFFVFVLKASLRATSVTMAQRASLLGALCAIVVGAIPLRILEPGLIFAIAIAIEVLLLCQGWWLVMLQGWAGGNAKKRALVGGGFLFGVALLHCAMHDSPMESGMGGALLLATLTGMTIGAGMLLSSMEWDY